MVSTIGIVSLSSGVIGEYFVKHEVDLGIQRLKDLGLNSVFLPHSLKGLDFIKEVGNLNLCLSWFDKVKCIAESLV
jgi:muramoyltetrapeptide carboxypeptidase LdcA involved in peptidoglycan recycling